MIDLLEFSRKEKNRELEIKIRERLSGDCISLRDRLFMSVLNENDETWEKYKEYFRRVWE